MGIWSRLFGRGSSAPAEPPAPVDTPEGPAVPANTVELPAEPFVFECQSCGKVFEARRKRPRCPECDSTEVSLLSD